MHGPYIRSVPRDWFTNEWAIMQSRRPPSDEEWRIAKIDHRRGTHVNGIVLSHHAFGFFIDLGVEPIEVGDNLGAVDGRKAS